MSRPGRFWIPAACLLSWALGPAIGIGLAAHELEHHELASQDHSHVTQAAKAFLHGHLHDEDANDHRHETLPPSFTPSRLSGKSQAATVAATVAGPSLPSDLSRPLGRRLEPVSLGPPDLFGLCVLRL